MNKPFIKICGITEPHIAQYLVAEHVDLMGFIFYPHSPRYITLDKAKEILNSLKELRKKIKVVGVFVDEEINSVKKIGEELSLDYLQLHGNETAEYINQLDQFNIIKVFRATINFKKADIDKYSNKNIKYILIDTFIKEKKGGTGEKFNWAEFTFLQQSPNLIISGGLKNENILEAIERFNPAGIDINSGVEFEPGIKNKEKIKEIITTVYGGQR